MGKGVGWRLELGGFSDGGNSIRVGKGKGRHIAVAATCTLLSTIIPLGSDVNEMHKITPVPNPPPVNKRKLRPWL